MLSAAARAWVEEVLGQPVADVVPLTGGMTSTMSALTDASGRRSVLRLMTVQPWRTHGVELTERESEALRALTTTPVPAPHTLAVGEVDDVAAHLMTLVPGRPMASPDRAAIEAMAQTLATIHEVRPESPFRRFQSWAWEAKWVTPPWSEHPDAWRLAFELVAGPAPDFDDTFLHRDFSHRNLLWNDAAITGVVDWVETSTGPAWLDVGHGATNLAVAFGPAPARAFDSAYADLTGRPPERHWMVMDAVGFLPPPGKRPMFDHPGQLARLDDWLHELMTGA